MTLAQLNDICKRNNVPDDVKLLSDSGWEDSATPMDGVWYSKEANMIVFTPDIDEYDDQPYDLYHHESKTKEAPEFIALK